jgi:hypothetical protein
MAIKNKGDRKAQKKRYYARYPEKLAAQYRRSYRRRGNRPAETLSDSYIKTLLVKSVKDLKRNAIPQALIAAKRLHMQLTRKKRSVNVKSKDAG